MALIKCLEPDCKKIVSDKAEYCPECGFPIAATLKERQEKSPERTAELAAEHRREVRLREEKEEEERIEREREEEIENAKKLLTFKNIRAKLDE